jgi:phosphatidylserine/phosphatidylglycerophosphate/cardiolipin synthase-like enzyme
MATEISVVTNCDDAVVFWRSDKPIQDCYGFAVERERKVNGSIERKPLDNMTGFEKDQPKQGDHRPSTVWPFQRYWWADHSASYGDKVRYRATPMIHKPGGLVQDMSGASGWTPWVDLTGDAGDGISSYFNRGLVISQFMARYLDELRQKKGLASMDATLAAFKKSLDEHELPIRQFLAGELRKEMLRLVQDAKKNGRHVYAALYELDDDELCDALAALKGRGHLVLANGSITAAKGEGVAAARKRDENKVARKRMQNAGLEVFGRFVSPGALGHNKFLVVASAAGKAQAAWTGSTNWTKTGLCTQINNGMLVENAAFADEYLQQWRRLRDAKNDFPQTLVSSNSQPKKVKVGKSSGEIWFSRTAKDVDLDALDAAIQGAQKAVLFLMFQPGNKGALGTVKKMLANPGGRYIKGVVSTLPPESAAAEDHVDVSVHTGATRHSVGLDIVQPEGIKQPFANWAATVTRHDFLPHKIAGGASGGIGFAIVHSKLIVIDPFTRPVVITGSHNFSSSASEKNDENFVIVRGNKDLALDYAAHILSVYHHYRWLSFVNEMQAKGKNPKAWLDENDQWQKLSADGKKELDFWLP